jgi:hypothetical protein
MNLSFPNDTTVTNNIIVDNFTYHANKISTLHFNITKLYTFSVTSYMHLCHQSINFHVSNAKRVPSYNLIYLSFLFLGVHLYMWSKIF